ncbi:MAG: NADH-quinone oxidoreductase subunit NuoB [Alphaproteobacteria bacterium]|nr:NADH-quinone oxidoreductase subunit NuoB [Alphaproteobacteria bacterium]
MEIKEIDWLDQMRQQGFAAITLRVFAAWVQENAAAAMPVSMGCCSCFGQLQQVGVAPVFNPHHADVLVVSGALSNKAAFVLRRIYDQMPSPKYVIAMGTCAVNKGLFAHSYAVADVADIVPVDVFIPGCPPGAKEMTEGIRALRRVIRDKIRNV